MILMVMENYLQNQFSLRSYLNPITCLKNVLGKICTNFKKQPRKNNVTCTSGVTFGGF